MNNKNFDDLNNRLFAELEALQSLDGCQDEKTVETAIRRAEVINYLAGRLVDIKRTQLEACKIAYNAGFAVKIPTSLGVEMLENKE